MKICAKCKTEYPDDMAFCTRCGTTLQSKVKEHTCPACGKVLGKDTLQFCPYCGYELASPDIIKPDSNNNVCPACRKVIYAKNLDVCPYCGHELASPVINKTDNNKTYVTVNKPATTDLKNSNSDDSEKSSGGGFLKNALTIIGIIILMGFGKACGRILYRGTTGYQKGFLIGAVFAGIVGGIIPAFVAYKCCKFDNPSTAVWIIFIFQIIVSILSAYQIVPLGSIPIGIILAILLYLFNKK